MNPLFSAAGFIGLYILLGAASFIHPLHELNITLWNPAPALGLVLVLRGVRGARLTWVTAVLLGELFIRGAPQDFWANLLATSVLAFGYLLLAEAARSRLSLNRMFSERQALINWGAIITLGTLLNSILYVGSLWILGLLPDEGALPGILQFWLGDSVGIVVAMPVFWWLSDRQGWTAFKAVTLQLETLAYSLLGIAALWVTFGLSGENGFKLFYLLFLPIIWAAARQGMAGAIISASQLQLGVILSVQMQNYSAGTAAELQTLALFMTLIGFFVGSVVDEQRRTSEELKKSLRLAAAGESSGAVAHELNQPLTALGAYALACETLLERGETGPRLAAAFKGMQAETARAGNVVRRLRDFFRTGSTQLEPLLLADLTRHVSHSFMEKGAEQGIVLDIQKMPDVTLLVDRLQIEIVLRNLLANAFDEVAHPEVNEKRVWMKTALLTGNRIEITVEDSGRGLSTTDIPYLPSHFHSSKSTGMGLGLVISRAIVETHGGELTAEIAEHGIFRINLPIHCPPT